MRWRAPRCELCEVGDLSPLKVALWSRAWSRAGGEYAFILKNAWACVGVFVFSFLRHSRTHCASVTTNEVEFLFVVRFGVCPIGWESGL